MKIQLTVLLCFINALLVQGQSSLVNTYAQVLRQEIKLSPDSIAWLGKELTAAGLAGAAQHLLESTGSAVPTVEQDVHFLTAFSFDSLASTFNYDLAETWTVQVKSIKKMPLKLAFVDSILNANSATELSPQTYFFLSKNPWAIKKWKGPLLGKINEIDAEKNTVVALRNYAYLHQAAKWIKDTKSMNFIKEKVNAILGAMPNKEKAFYVEVMKTPVIQVAATPPTMPEKKDSDNGKRFMLPVIIGISILVLVFFTLFLTKNHQLNKSKHQLALFQNKAAKSENELSERENAIIQTNQDLIAENKRLLSQLKQSESTLKNFEHQCTMFNDDLKKAIDNLSREHTIQHVLEANNALTRNMAKMKELLNSH